MKSVTKTFFAALNCRDIVDYYFDIIKEISNLQLEDNELSILATLFLLDSSKMTLDDLMWHQMTLIWPVRDPQNWPISAQN